MRSADVAIGRGWLPGGRKDNKRHQRVHPLSVAATGRKHGVRRSNSGNLGSDIATKASMAWRSERVAEAMAGGLSINAPIATEAGSCGGSREARRGTSCSRTLGKLASRRGGDGYDGHGGGTG